MSFADEPLQIVPSLEIPEDSLTVMEATGSALIVIILVADAVHPFELVTVTVYVVVTVGLTLIDTAVEPVFQRYVPPPLAVRVAAAPTQRIPSLLFAPEVSVAVTDADGSGFTVIVLVDVAVQPLALVTVTVYVVVTEGETEMETPVPPLLHK